MEEILEQVRKELLENSDVDIQESGQRYFKERIQCYGVRTATVGSISKIYYKMVSTLSKNQVFELCELLFQSGMMEESFIACNWSEKVKAKFEPHDFDLFERWIDNYISNWATCDTFCNHTMGAFIEKYPDFIEKLKMFGYSDNRWKRRAGAVSLIVPARKGKFLSEIFDIADTVLLDKDDMVQKGYGWLLKVASQAHQKEVFDYVMKHKTVMPRTALRYAIEKMPAELKKQAMAKG